MGATEERTEPGTESAIVELETMSAYDLHAHTIYSDGTLTPAEVVGRARANGVSTLAVTDHDVTDGLAEAGVAAAMQGVRLIPGVEISVTWECRTIHVVGLGIDPANPALQAGLSQLREFRWRRAQEIARRLARKNIPDALARTRRLARGAVLSRTHFARFLVSNGYVRDMGQAFRSYLGRGRAAHVPSQWAPLSDAVDWIRGAGGVAVIAHPSRYPLASGALRRLLQVFRECGGGAIEVVSGSTHESERKRLSCLAAEFGLFASSGSDYHGPEMPWAELGRLPALAPELTPVWNVFAANQP